MAQKCFTVSVTWQHAMPEICRNYTVANDASAENILHPQRRCSAGLPTDAISASFLQLFKYPVSSDGVVPGTCSYKRPAAFAGTIHAMWREYRSVSTVIAASIAHPEDRIAVAGYHLRRIQRKTGLASALSGLTQPVINREIPVCLPDLPGGLLCYRDHGRPVPAFPDFVLSTMPVSPGN
jgi:hypothetical protein